LAAIHKYIVPQYIARLQDIPDLGGTPSVQQSYVWNAANTEWELTEVARLDTANTFTAGQVFLTGATGTSPIIFRQTGGVAGTDELTISHDGTDATIENKDRSITIKTNNSANARIFLQARDITYTFTDGTGAGFTNPASLLQSGTIRIGASTRLGWSSNTVPEGAANDTELQRVVAGVIAIFDGDQASDVSLQLRRKSDTTNRRELMSVTGSWADAADENRKSRVVMSVYDATAAREFMRAESDGSAARVAIGGAVGGAGTLLRLVNPLDITRFLDFNVNSGTWTIGSQSSLILTASDGGTLNMGGSGGTRLLGQWAMGSLGGTSNNGLNFGTNTRAAFGGAGLSSGDAHCVLSDGQGVAANRVTANTWTIWTGRGVPFAGSNSGNGGDVIFDLGRGADASGAAAGKNGRLIIRPDTGVSTGDLGPLLVVQNTSAASVLEVTADGKVGLFATAPATQPIGSSDVLQSLVDLGLRATSSNPPLNLGTGAITCGAITATAVASTVSDSATTTATTVLTLGHNTSGTAADGFGLTKLINLATDTTADTNAFTETVTWATAAHASRKARVVYSVYDATAAREFMRAESDGTTAKLIASTGVVYFENTNHFISSNDGTNFMYFSSSGGTVHMRLSGANLFLDVPTFSGGDGVALNVRTANRGGNAGDGPTMSMFGGNGSTAGDGGHGGNVQLYAGNAGAGDKNGGNVLVYGGIKSGAGTDGAVRLAYNGTAAFGRVSFFDATPTTQPSGDSDVLASLVTLGLRAATDNPPLNLGTGSLTAGATNVGAFSATSITATGTVALTDHMTITDGKNILLNTTTGTKIGTATTQKLGFFDATPVEQQAGNSDVLASLVTLGLRATSDNPPLNLGTGALTAGTTGVGAFSATSITGTGTVALTDHMTVTDTKNIILNTTTGSQIGTTTGQKLAFHGSAPVIQRAGASQAAVDTTGATNVGPYGYTEAQANAIVTLLNEIRAALVEKGLIKGSS
jgi:hypothetical protein